MLVSGDPCVLTKAIMDRRWGTATGVWGLFYRLAAVAKYSCHINILLNFIGKHSGQKESVIPRVNLVPHTAIPVHTYAESPGRNLTCGQQRLKNKERTAQLI